MAALHSRMPCYRAVPLLTPGDPNFVGPPDYDQRGPDYDRVRGGRIDVGSFEVQNPPSTYTYQLQDLHQLLDLALAQYRARSFPDEKKTHSSIRFLSSAGFVDSPSLGRCQLDFGHDGAGLLGAEAPKRVSEMTLTFAERVAYQRAIENVHWRHRIWPKERPDPKPSLDAVISQAQLEKKVADYLRKSQSAGGLLPTTNQC